MIKQFIGKSIPTLCVFVCTVSAPLAHADWSGERQTNSANPGYGNFPPQDIEEKLFGHLEQDNSQATSTNAENTSLPPVVNNQRGTNAPNANGTYHPYSSQNRQPGYGWGNNYPPTANQQRRANPRYRNSNEPWNNNQNSFSMPWGGGNGNRGPSFSGPWDNNGSNMSGPWNNGRSSSFTGPWNNNNNNGSNFSMPWGNNNGNNFAPWGNGNSWGW